jgi:heme-degrading monooxygenase HmoA
MIVSLSIVRYRRLFIPFALLAMAVHRIPLAMNKKCRFWKLMGCGRNGTFDLQPDWQQWALMATWDSEEDFNKFNTGSFISWWWKTFTTEKWTLLSVPLASHGKWDGIEPFKMNDYDKDHSGPVAVLTRATIRFNKLKRFWTHVDPVAQIMTKAKGYLTSVGIGEAPFIRQATISIWDNMENMKAFAYGSKEHADVIKKTRKEDWYSEELFARFKIISGSGTLNAIDPLKEIKDISRNK